MSKIKNFLFGLHKALNRVSGCIAVIERILCSILISAFTILIMANVLSRYAFDSPLFFADELALLFLVWMGYLAIAYSVFHQKQIGMGIVVDSLPDKARQVVSIVVDIFMLAVSILLLWTTFQWLQSPSMAYQRSVALDILKWPFYTIIPIFWSLLIIHLADQLLTRLVRFPEPG